MELGLNFSKRLKGNCRSLLEFIKQDPAIGIANMDIIDVPRLDISSCCDYNYSCFKIGKCVYNDDMTELIEQIITANKIYVALPVYRGHLCSEYFKVHERLVGNYRLDDNKLVKDYLDKAIYLLFVNRNAGLERAIEELKSDIVPYGASPSIITISSRDYDESSIDGKLAYNLEFQDNIRNDLRDNQTI